MPGVRVVTSLDGSVPLLHVSVAFAVGSVSDPQGKEGLTRLVLRLLRRSAGGRTANACDEELDQMGGALSGEVNRSVASLHGGVITRNSEEFLSFVRDTLCRPKFDGSEFERAVRETVAELVDSLDNDSGLVRAFWSRRFFEGHAYARPTAGTRATLEAINLRDVQEHFERLWTAGPLTVALSGMGDEAVLRHWAEAVQQEGASSVGEGSHSSTAPEGVHGRTLLFVDKPERAQTQILIGCQGTHARDEDHTALFVGHTIFGGTFTARLSQEVRAKRGWSYGAYSSLPYERVRQPLTMWTFPRAEDAAECIALELSMLERLLDRGVTKREVAAAKKYLTRSHVFNLDTPAKRAALEFDALNYDLPNGYYDAYRERVAAVTKSDVDAALRRRLSASDLLVTVVGTHGQIGQAVAEAIPDLETSTVSRFDSVM